MKKLIITALLCCLSVTVCAEDDVGWLRFFDSPKLVGKRLRVNQSPELHKLQKYQVAGNLYFKDSNLSFPVFKYTNDKVFNILDNNQPLSTINKNTFKKLGNSKSIRVFAYSNNTINVSDFHAKNTICSDFDNNYVKSTITSNYYLTGNIGFATSSIVKIYKDKKSVLLLETNNLDDIKDKRIYNLIKQMQSQNLKNLTIASVEERKRFLNDLCSK